MDPGIPLFLFDESCDISLAVLMINFVSDESSLAYSLMRGTNFYGSESEVIDKIKETNDY